jgi:hypothetical protein
MATFYVEGKVDLTILVDDSRNARVTKNCLSYMFGFQHGYIHVSIDDTYDNNSVIQNSIYQESISNPNGVHWDVKARRYRIIGDNLIQCFQRTILTPWTTTYVANVAPKAFIVKQEVLDKEDTQVSSLHFPFINLY